jgi:hypothetical protein
LAAAWSTCVLCIDEVDLGPDLLVPEILAALIQVFIIVELGLVAGDCLALDGIVQLKEQLAFADVIPYFDIEYRVRRRRCPGGRLE